MRNSYMVEYQANFDQNSSRRDNRIAEMNQSIDTQEDSIKDLNKVDEMQESCMNRFFNMKCNSYNYRICFKAWLYYTKVQKRKSRVQHYCNNKIHRAKMRRLFDSWRGVTHTWFKERLDREKTSFRMELESKMLVKWSTKVDSLLLYMAQLEDKIKMEQDAREVLTHTYDASLNTGFNRLNVETHTLSQNPLIHEVIIPKVPEMNESETDFEADVHTRVVRHARPEGVTSPAFPPEIESGDGQ